MPDHCADWVRTITWQPNYPKGNVKVDKNKITFSSTVKGYEGKKTTIHFEEPPKKYKPGEKVTLTLKAVSDEGGPIAYANYRLFSINSFPVKQSKPCSNGYRYAYVQRQVGRRSTTTRRAEPFKRANPTTQFSYTFRPWVGDSPVLADPGDPIGPQIVLEAKCSDSKTPYFKIKWTYEGRGKQGTFGSSTANSVDQALRVLGVEDSKLPAMIDAGAKTSSPGPVKKGGTASQIERERKLLQELQKQMRSIPTR